MYLFFILASQFFMAREGKLENGIQFCESVVNTLISKKTFLN